MKRIITLVVAAVMMTIATNSFAQMSVGVGALHANDQITLKGTEPVDLGLNGFYAGFSYNLPIVDVVGITPGLYYSMLFANDSEFDGKLGAKIREHFINVPVYVNVGFNLGERSRFFVFAGPTAQFGISSTAQLTVNGENSPKSDRYKDGDYSRTNLLLGGGLGLNISRIQITAGYDQGIFNLDTSNDGTKRTKSYAKLGIAYLF
ncbi:MAG: outer membrane beta-barrel protein [Bacteroidales bacterium]|nr:outer membrane beta-barrel protein [Bacteroidales bacterium]